MQRPRYFFIASNFYFQIPFLRAHYVKSSIFVQLIHFYKIYFEICKTQPTLIYRKQVTLISEILTLKWISDKIWTSRLFKHELIICNVQDIFLLHPIFNIQILFLKKESQPIKWDFDFWDKIWTFGIVFNWKEINFLTLFVCLSVSHFEFELSKLKFVIDSELFGLPNWAHYTRVTEIAIFLIFSPELYNFQSL